MDQADIASDPMIDHTINISNQNTDPLLEVPPVAGGPPLVDGSPPPAATEELVEEGELISNKRKRTAKIWEMWDVVEIPDPDNVGLTIEIAHCKICGDSKIRKSKNGTSHFIRHTEICSKKHKVDLKQSTISQTQFGTLASFKYSFARARDNMIKLVIMMELPFQFVEDKFLEFVIADSFHPSYKMFSRGTVRNRLLKLFADEKAIVKKMLLDCPGKISLTSDLWKSNQNLSYMALTAHFIDSGWILQKRIIAYCLLDKTHTGEHIAQLIFDKLCEWEISHKVFCLSLDNASANTVSVLKLKNLLPNLPLNGDIFHVRCCCHILNLVVQDGLRVQQFKDMLFHLKSNIEYIMVSDVRYEQYRALCVSIGMAPKKLQLDVKHRWNSTYLMLKAALPYQNAMTLFLFDRACPCVLTEEDWMYAQLLCKFLMPFYEATNFFSGVTYETSSRVLEHLLDIGQVFKEYRGNPLFGDIVKAMEAKFVKYWGDTPVLFGIACVLDPRVKSKVELVLEELEYCFETSAYSIKCSYSQSILIDVKLQELFEEYTQSMKEILNSSNASSPSSPSTPVAGNSSFVVCEGSSRRGSFWRSIGRGRRDPIAAASEELARYKSEPEPILENIEAFKTLSWWLENEKRFPVLSMIARDILSVPVSTVASESAFSCGKRILGDYRSCLSPDMLELSVILKDWWKVKYKGLFKTLNPIDDAFECYVSGPICSATAAVGIGGAPPGLHQ